MPYTLFGNWEEPPTDEAEKPERKLKKVDLCRVYYESGEKAEEDAKKINETNCLLTMSYSEWKQFKRWEKEDRRNK